MAARGGADGDGARFGRRDRREPRARAARARRLGRCGRRAARRVRAAVVADEARRRRVARDSVGSARSVTRRSRAARRHRCSSSGRCRRWSRCCSSTARSPNGFPGCCREARSPRAASRSRAWPWPSRSSPPSSVVAFGPTIADRLGRHVWPGLDPSIGDALDAPSSLRAADQPRHDPATAPVGPRRVHASPRAARRSGAGRRSTRGTAARGRRSDPRTAQLPLGGHGRRAAATRTTSARSRAGRCARRSGSRPTTPTSCSRRRASSPCRPTRWWRVTPTARPRVYGGFGRGATYTVTSRSLPVTAAAAPQGEQANRCRPTCCGGSPSPRRRPTASTQLAQAITASAPTTYDKILAIEAWLGDHVRYSLNAPLSPPGVDVVDDFLFRSRVGWCEQVASSLVVLARSVGIPARLADRLRPGTARPAERGVRRARARRARVGRGLLRRRRVAAVRPDRVGAARGRRRRRRFLARQPRGTTRSSSGLLAAALVLLVVGAPEMRRAMAAPAGPPARGLGAPVRSTGWSASDARPAAPVAPSETPREYASALAVYLHDERIRAVGETLDRRRLLARRRAGIRAGRRRRGAILARTVKGIP